MKIQWTIIIGLIFAIIIAVFAVVNVDDVPVNYMFGEARWPLILVILGSALIGALISACFSIFKIFSAGRKVSALEKHLRERDALVVQKDREINRLQDDLQKPPPVIEPENPDRNVFP
jgi:lipopolysaccharide assembly protein A